ncbi:MAG: hypothetical protein ISP86_03290 [Shewanellaceae bacterium]|nr:hypothetical protein [Shewanellaceae bacterium]
MQQLNLADNVVRHIAGGYGSNCQFMQTMPSYYPRNRRFEAVSLPQQMQPVILNIRYRQIPARPFIIYLNGWPTVSRSLPPSYGSDCAYA